MTRSNEAFKAYDIRGIYDKDIDAHLAFLLGKGIATYLIKQYGKQSKLLYASDTRWENTALIDAFLAGLQTNNYTNFFGVSYQPEIPHPDPTKKLDYGVCSTGFAYYFGSEYSMTVIFSASHNPAGHVGIKIVDHNGLFLSTELLHKLVTQESDHDFTDHIVIQHPDHSYLSQISHRKSDLFSSLIDLFNQCKKKHHFVVDYSNGAGVSFEYQFLEHYATKDHRIHHINAFADGSFPAHSSDTLEHQNYNQLIEKIKEQNAEFGIMFDGDADRIGFVSPTGRVIGGDIITAIISKHLLQKTKKTDPIIMYDLTCSRIVPKIIEQYGGKAIKTRVGRALIATDLAQQGGIFAGEMSGHFIFGDSLRYHEMPLLALCYVLHELEHFAHFDEMIDAYTIGYKGELINFIVEDKNATLTMLKEKFSDYPQDELDGLTITAPTRWCNIRKSNTENKLRMTMEADTQQIFEQQKTLISSYIVQQGA